MSDREKRKATQSNPAQIKEPNFYDLTRSPNPLTLLTLLKLLIIFYLRKVSDQLLTK